MHKIDQIAIILLLIFSPALIQSQTISYSKITHAIIQDYHGFYSWKNLSRLALGLGYGAFYANTTFDAEIQNLYHDFIRTKTTNDISRVVKQLGNGRFTVPFYLALAGLGCIASDRAIPHTLGLWGQECTRALIVGVPLVLGLQVMTGASRPNENHGSHWQPFKDNNGVSGHSFMGAVPFLIVAKHTNHGLMRIPWYLGSALTALSRINDNQHYFSQAFLGWWIAWLATNSIKLEDVNVTADARGVRIMIAF